MSERSPRTKQGCDENHGERASLGNATSSGERATDPSGDGVVELEGHHVPLIRLDDPVGDTGQSDYVVEQATVDLVKTLDQVSRTSTVIGSLESPELDLGSNLVQRILSTVGPRPGINAREVPLRCPLPEMSKP